MLKGRKILIGITGSIAAYKSAFLVRLLVKEGAEVRVIMTEASTHFIPPLTLSTLSKSEVHTSISDEHGWNNHVELGLWADLFLIAPCSANTLSKMASGMCDNMLLACYLSSRAPVYVAPAMDEDMWKHPSTQRNLSQLQGDGVRVIPVGSGELASGLVGPGRMAEPEDIITVCHAFFKEKQDLVDYKAVVTAGPTYEDIDPVRYIGNRSSGKMGIAIAEALAARGAQVHLVLGPTQVRVADDDRIKVDRVRSAADMLEAVDRIWDSVDIGVMAAAVADYSPAMVAKEKIKKKEGPLSIELGRTVDIAATIGARKQAHQISVGFALETEDEEVNAQQKLNRKNFDLIVLNSLNDKGAGFAHDTNKVTLFGQDGFKKQFELKRKTEVAIDIVNQIAQLVRSKK